MEIKKLIAIIITFITLAVCVIVPIIYEIDSACNRYEITATVTDKGIKNSENSGIYLIYGKKENGCVCQEKIEPFAKKKMSHPVTEKI